MRNSSPYFPGHLVCRSSLADTVSLEIAATSTSGHTICFASLNTVLNLPFSPQSDKPMNIQVGAKCHSSHGGGDGGGLRKSQQLVQQNKQMQFSLQQDKRAPRSCGVYFSVGDICILEPLRQERARESKARLNIKLNCSFNVLQNGSEILSQLIISSSSLNIFLFHAQRRFGH